jgi:hypothetical protein
VNTIPQRTIYKKEGCILVHDFRNFALSWWGGHGKAELFNSWQPGNNKDRRGHGKIGSLKTCPQ